MTHSRIVMQRGGRLFHKDCLVEAEPLDSEVSVTTLDKDDMCSECDNPLLVDDETMVVDSDDDDEEDD